MILRVSALLLANRMSVVEPNQPFAIPTVES